MCVRVCVEREESRKRVGMHAYAHTARKGGKGVRPLPLMVAAGGIKEPM